jgi:hypothetical protein
MTSDPRLHELRRLLQKALELELFTIPPYLTALYSIKDDANVPSVKIIQSVVMEEMLHATLVSNIINAVGGEPLVSPEIAGPRLEKRSYPSAVPHINLNINVRLSRFSKETLTSFRTIEEPEKPADWSASAKRGEIHSIGHLYQIVLDRLVTVTGELGEQAVFNGDPARQISRDQYYGGGGRVIVVRGLSDAREAIAVVAQEGEGRVELTNLTGDEIRFKQPNQVAHYYRFEQILAGRYYDRDDDLGLDPAGPELRVDWRAVHDVRDDPAAGRKAPPDGLQRLLDRFEQTYGGLLRSLHEGFNGDAAALRHATATMHDLKTQCIGLMRIDIGGGKTCGPPFYYVQAV